MDRPLPRQNLVVTSAEGSRLDAELADAGAANAARGGVGGIDADPAWLGDQGLSAKWYLVVAGYATLIGIVTPHIVLTVGPTALDAALRWLLFGAFCTVVVAILSTFAITIRVRGKVKLACKRS